MKGSFALNLIILAASTIFTYYVSHSEAAQLAVGYTSVSIALLTFIGILAFQLANVTGAIQYLERKCGAFKACMTQISDGEIEVESDTNSLPHRVLNPGEYEPVPQTAQGNTSAEPTGSDDEEPRKRICLYL